MKYFVTGLLTPPFLWTCAYFISWGWHAGRPERTINVNLNSARQEEDKHE